MEHAFEVEGLLARQLGDDDVEKDAEDGEEEVELHGVNRALDRVHLPVDVGVEWRRERAERLVERFDEAGLGDGRVDDVGPAALDEDVDAAHDGACQEGCPCAGRRAEAAVEAERHDGAGAADPHGAGERDEHLDVVQLFHVVGAGEEEEADADGDDADHPDMLLHRERLLPQRKHHVLRDGERGAVDAGVVGREHGQEEKKREEAEEAVRQNGAHGHREVQLVEERAALLELVVGDAFPFLNQNHLFHFFFYFFLFFFFFIVVYTFYYIAIF